MLRSETASPKTAAGLSRYFSDALLALSNVLGVGCAALRQSRETKVFSKWSSKVLSQ